MEENYSVVLFEEYTDINFYTIQYEGDKYSEVEKFLSKFPEGGEHDKEVDVILSWLDRIAEKGALERYFKPEGRYGDGVSAIPIEAGNIRLYCLRLSDNILIIGNGGIKNVDKWQSSSTLSSYVQLLIDTGKFINSRIVIGKVTKNKKELIGNLKFKRHEKE